MVRVLFSVNQHPNEAFAISVARRIAKLFQKEGFEVLVEGKDKIPEKPRGNELILMKIKVGETVLGTVLREKPRENLSGAEMIHIDGKAVQKAIRFTHETNSDISYRFHCTDATSGFWKEKPAADFNIKSETPNGRFQVIEIKARFKKMPERILKKTLSRTESNTMVSSAMVDKYLITTTSQSKSRQSGLDPQEFARAIAATIKTQIKDIGQGKRFARHVRGKIRRKIRRQRKRQEGNAPQAKKMPRRK